MPNENFIDAFDFFHLAGDDHQRDGVIIGIFSLPYCLLSCASTPYFFNVFPLGSVVFPLFNLFFLLLLLLVTTTPCFHELLHRAEAEQKIGIPMKLQTEVHLLQNFSRAFVSPSSSALSTLRYRTAGFAFCCMLNHRGADKRRLFFCRRNNMIHKLPKAQPVEFFFTLSS